MAINIKEIFNTDSDVQKVEKLNYNFDQILANGGGPVGATGSTGPQGAVGATGAQGAVGPTGLQGPAGISTDYFWKDAGSPQRDTLFPVPGQGKGANTMVLGDDTVGTQNQTYPYTDSALYLKGNITTGMKPLRFGDAFGGYIDIDYNETPSARTIDFIPASQPGLLNTNYVFNGQTLKLVDGTDKVVLNSTLTEFNVDTVFTGNLKISQPTGNGYILKSDAVGNASWQPLVTTPIGTMVMVPGFVLQNAVDWTPGNLASSYAGRGKNGGQYGDWRGWYFCFGKTWGSFATPNMLDRYPKGVNTTNGTGADVPGGSASSAFSVNVPNHNHTMNFAEVEVAGSGPGITEYVLQGDTIPPATGPNNPITKTTSSAGGHTVSSSVTVDPKHITVGYMIYLGATNLSWIP